MVKVRRICDKCNEYKTLTFKVNENTHILDSVHFPIKYLCPKCINKKAEKNRRKQK